MRPAPPLDLSPKQTDTPKGGPGVGFTKNAEKQGVPRDTDFMQPGPKPPASEGAIPGVPEGAFRITNVNKPAPPAQAKGAPEKKDKAKSNRETLIPGFQPKEKRLTDEPQ
ncbi:MAG: hypothetical protein ACM3L6_05835 [Deltaproteobacteria bacterium]